MRLWATLESAMVRSWGVMNVKWGVYINYTQVMSCLIYTPQRDEQTPTSTRSKAFYSVREIYAVLTSSERLPVARSRPGDPRSRWSGSRASNMRFERDDWTWAQLVKTRK